MPLSTALRDRSEDMARVLNRSRKVRKERITRNTIIRVALQHFLDTFTLEPEQSVDGEADLLHLLRSKQRQTTPPDAS